MCKQAPKNGNPEIAYGPEEKDEKSETVLISEGWSSQGTYSPSGDRLLFVSAKRRAHPQGQAYEYFLDRKTERRITFQDGNVFQPRFHPKEDLIIYSSSTDEHKEYSPLLNPADPNARKLPDPFSLPMEVYVHSLGGLEIQRITQRQGFDGEARFSADGNLITWTEGSSRGVTTVVRPRAQNGVKPINGITRLTSSYSSSPDGAYRAWLDWDKEVSGAQIILQMGKVKSTLNVDASYKMDLGFSADSKWLLWANRVGDQLDLWAYDLVGGCATRLTSTPQASEKDPAISPDGQWLTYTKITKARSRIMRRPFAGLTAPCPPPG